MKIYFIRHGQYNISRLDAGELTLVGRVQADRLGQRFLDEKVKFDGVWSSDIIRAKETADIFCEKINFPIDKIIEDSRFIEERDYEEPEDVVERMECVIDDVLKKGDELGKGLFAVFSHSGAIKYLISSYCGKEIAKNISRLPHCGIHLVNYEFEGVENDDQGKPRDIWMPRIDERYHGYKHLEEIRTC